MSDRKTLLHLALVVILFCLVNTFLFHVHGVRIVNDSARHLGYAQTLRSGFSFDAHKFWYIAYAFIIFICNQDVTTVVVIQYALSLLAVVALYYSALLLWESSLAALISALAMIAFVDVSLWNSYILAESVYTSFTCFAILLCVLYYKKLIAAWPVILIVLFTSLIKPTGGCLIVACIVFKISQLEKGTWFDYTLLLCLLLFLANQMLPQFNVMENYQSGEIIHGINTVKDYYNLNGLIVTPPADLYNASEDLPYLLRIVLVGLHHPVYCLQLFFTKLFFLLFHVRPYWSATHNILSVLFLLPAYALFFYAVIKAVIPKPLLVFGITYLLMHIFAIGITFDDWDGRFLIPMLPVIFLFAGRSLAKLISSLPDPT